MDREKKNYRKFYRIFLILFLVSFSANLFMLSLHLRERKTVPPLPPKEVKEVRETKESDEVKEEKASQAVVPFPLIHVKSKDHFLLCDKEAKLLHLYRSEESSFPLVKSYPCIVGSNHVDKKEAGDLATPEGVYFLTSFIAGKNLPEKYGVGAFSLNYPNFLDRKEGKKGSGIWLHGYSDRLERPPFSEGCVVVEDAVLKELMGFIKVGETPLVIVDSTKYKPIEEQQRLSKLLSQFLREWKTAWEKRDTARYLSFYSRDFVSSDGKNYQKFKEYKYRVNQSKKFIQIQLEPKSLFLSQKGRGSVAIVRLNQDYRSDNFKSYSRKILYLREKEGRWEIIGENTV
ncbi:MAG: L,D-transpeptidase family protein [Syntrophaceae bacterium]|nr:L,D-transpeptidase family protein [Syntrophaceae bacterium]